MKSENLLEGFDGDVNIESAERLIDELGALSPLERSSRISELNEKFKALQELQNNGIDAENIRIALAKLTRLREEAEDAGEEAK